MNSRPYSRVATLAACLLALSSVVQAHVRLDHPVGGETLIAGDSLEIQWDAYIFHGPGTITLEFSSDDGQNYTTIVSGISVLSEQDAVGSYSWNLPNEDTSTARVKVLYLADSGGSYTDTSAPFTIQPAGVDSDEQWTFNNDGFFDYTISSVSSNGVVGFTVTPDLVAAMYQEGNTPGYRCRTHAGTMRGDFVIAGAPIDDPIAEDIPAGDMVVQLQVVAEGFAAPLGVVEPDDGTFRIDS